VPIAVVVEVGPEVLDLLVQVLLMLAELEVLEYHHLCQGQQQIMQVAVVAQDSIQPALIHMAAEPEGPRRASQPYLVEQ
jgi:hypothetical protein